MSCSILVKELAGVQVVSLEGPDFSMPQLAQLRQVLQGLPVQAVDAPLAIDTTGLELLGSCCLSGIIDMALFARRSGRDVFLVETRPAIIELFQIASLDSILPVHPDVRSGIASRGGQAG